MTPGDHPVVAARQLTRRFGAVTVFRNLDFTARSGELWLLAGRNGSGKSTFLKVLAGLLRPQNGTVAIAGRTMDRRDPMSRQGLGYVGHETMLYDELTLHENLVFAARCQGLADAVTEVNRSLTEAGLAPRAGDLLGSLSRGTRQRAALARATIHQPALLLLDEPFTGLDPSSAAALCERLEAHRRKGGAAVVVTHRPAEAWELATHISLLANAGWAVSGPKSGTPESFERRSMEPAS